MLEQQDSIDDRLTFLITAEPVEPFGWFRWIFDRYATRCMQGGANHREKPLRQGWTHLSQNQVPLNQPEHLTQ